MQSRKPSTSKTYIWWPFENFDLKLKTVSKYFQKRQKYDLSIFPQFEFQNVSFCIRTTIIYEFRMVNKFAQKGISHGGGGWGGIQTPR